MISYEARFLADIVRAVAQNRSPVDTQSGAGIAELAGNCNTGAALGSTRGFRLRRDAFATQFAVEPELARAAPLAVARRDGEQVAVEYLRTPRLDVVQQHRLHAP